MVNDFETHPVGTAEEIKLSRDLARAVEQIIAQYGLVVPNSVVASYNKLLKHYEKQMEYYD